MGHWVEIFPINHMLYNLIKLLKCHNVNKQIYFCLELSECDLCIDNQNVTKRGHILIVIVVPEVLFTKIN